MKNSKPILTIFTPTFNRKHTLIRTYKSLCHQTYLNFIWMIIDDGSSDNTDKMVDEWLKENIIQIKYFYKTNGGMHTAHNLAYSLIETELNICIDSDDFMPENAVEIIIEFWQKNKNKKFSGIIGLNATPSGRIIGSYLPQNVHSTSLSRLVHDYHISGDKKIIYRTDVISSVQKYPEFENEKLVPLSYKYWLADIEYELLILNQIISYVEYQPDGSSNTIYKQYFQSPKGFAEFRKSVMKNCPYIKNQFIASIHYVSSSIISKNLKFIKESPRKILTLLAIPFGFILFIFLKFRVNKTSTTKIKS